MNVWQTDTARELAAPQEVELATRRRDGSLRTPRTIWIVAVGNQVFIRSTNGRGAAWFTAAVSTGSGQLTAGATTVDIGFIETSEADLPAVDRAYREKYGAYASIVDHLVEPGPRAATLEVVPG